MHEALVEESPLAQKVTVVRGLQDSCVLQFARTFKMLKDAAYVLIHCNQACVVILDGFFETAYGVARGRGADFIFGLHKGLRFSGIALQVVIESSWLWNSEAVIE